MTLLYVMTFGTFSGLSAQFGLLATNLYGTGNSLIVKGTGATAQMLVAGTPSLTPPSTSSSARSSAPVRGCSSPLTDRMGGARWTVVSGLGLVGSIIYTIGALVPDTLRGGAAERVQPVPLGMLAIFLFAGIGNASTFKQMPMIFERRQAGGVIGWTAAIAAFGPFLFGVGLTPDVADDLLLDRRSSR